MNLIQILKKLKAFGEAQKFINQVTIGDVYENWNGKPNMQYGALNLDVPNITVNSNLQSLQIYMYYADRLEHDHSNEYEIKTTAELVLNNIVNYAAELGDVDEGWQINFFNQQFADDLAGAWVSFYLEVQKPLGDCLIDTYEGEHEDIIERLKAIINQLEEENAELALELKEILYKLTAEIV